MNFTPGIFLTTYDLQSLPVIELIEKYNTLRKKCKEVFDFRWDNNILWITDVYGNAYKMGLTMNTCGGKIFQEVIVHLWSAQGTFVFQDCFKLQPDGKLDWNAVEKIRQVTESYTRGNFTCAFCGNTGRRFGEGTGHAPMQEVCATCFAKPKVKATIQRQFHDMSN